MTQRRPGCLQRRDGAVLPIALFGLLVISLLVASALLTASSELALSRAHQESIRSLFEADAALESFVATGDFRWTGDAGEPFDAAAAGIAGKAYAIRVTPLRRGEVTGDSLGSASRRDLFTVAAEPANGRGRLAAALVETVRTTPVFRSSIDAAATVGGQAVLSEDVTIAAGQSALCPTDFAPIGLRIGLGPATGGGASRIGGGVREDTISGMALAELALSGSNLDDVSQGATEYFGMAYGQPSFDAYSGPRHDAAIPSYRWGCPEALVFACPQEDGEAPVIVIDAGTGDAELNGGYGEGVLVIRGSGARLRGDFRFAGLVIVEGRLRMEDGAQIFGAAVVGGNLEAGSDAPGESAAIVFDRCSIEAAERALTIARLANAPQTLDSPTFGWYEIVR